MSARKGLRISTGAAVSRPQTLWSKLNFEKGEYVLVGIPVEFQHRCANDCLIFSSKTSGIWLLARYLVVAIGSSLGTCESPGPGR